MSFFLRNFSKFLNLGMIVQKAKKAYDKAMADGILSPLEIRDIMVAYVFPALELFGINLNVEAAPEIVGDAVEIYKESKRKVQAQQEKIDVLLSDEHAAE